MRCSTHTHTHTYKADKDTFLIKHNSEFSLVLSSIMLEKMLSGTEVKLNDLISNTGLKNKK